MPPGTEVTVRYDPARPGIGVIDPRAPALATLWLLFGFMAALCVALIALVYYL